MAKSGGKNTSLELKELLSADGDFLRAVMDVAVQAVLEAEMTEALSAEKARGWKAVRAIAAATTAAP